MPGCRISLPPDKSVRGKIGIKIYIKGIIKIEKMIDSQSS